MFNFNGKYNCDRLSSSSYKVGLDYNLHLDNASYVDSMV